MATPAEIAHAIKARDALFGLIRIYIAKQKMWPEQTVLARAAGTSTKRIARHLSILREHGRIQIYHFRNAPSVIEIPGVGSTLKTSIHRRPVSAEELRRKHYKINSSRPEEAAA